MRRIVRNFYGSGPNGITGNASSGQMSAWLDGNPRDATALPHAALLLGRRLELGPAR
jgi:hypothetical protein